MNVQQIGLDDAAVGIRIGSHRPKHWLAAWGAVFYGNLFIPLLYALIVLDSSGWAGATTGITLLFAASAYVQHNLPSTIPAMRRGALIVAVSQCLPVIHVFAGLFAIGFVRHFGLVSDLTSDQIEIDLICAPLNFLQGLIVSVVTGITILAVAAYMGLVTTAIVD